MKREQLIKHHNQSVTELNAEVAKLSSELVLRKLDLESNKLKNLHAVKNLRHDIARLKTLIRELELVNKSKQAQPSTVGTADKAQKEATKKAVTTKKPTKETTAKTTKTKTTTKKEEK